MEKVVALLTYVTVCGAVKEKMVFVLYGVRHAHKTDPVLSAAVFAILLKRCLLSCQNGVCYLAKAACTGVNNTSVNM